MGQQTASRNINNRGQAPHLLRGFALVVGVLFLSAACSLGSSGQGGQASPRASTKRIAFLGLQAGAKRYTVADVPYFKKAVEAAGYTAVVQFAENSQQTQINEAQSVLTQGIDVLVLQPVDVKAAAQIVTMAKQQGVPVISYNDLVSNAKITAFVGRSGVDAGALAANAAVTAFPTGNSVIVNGDAGQTIAQDEEKGYHQVLDPLVQSGKIKIVSDQYTPGWATAPALAQCENALTANHNNIQVLITSYDAFAAACIGSLKKANLAGGKVYVTGQDLEPEGAVAIADGDMGGTLWGSFDAMGTAAGQTAVTLAQGKTLTSQTTIDNGAGSVPYVKVPVGFVTKKDLPKFLCDHPWWLPISTVYAHIPQSQWPTCS